MTRRIRELEQQLAVSQKQCAEFATALGRNFLDESAGGSQDLQRDTIQIHQSRPQDLDHIGFQVDPQPDQHHHVAQHPSSDIVEAIPRNIPQSSAEDVETEVANLDEKGDAISSVHPELFDDPLLDNLSLSPVSSTYGYLHPGLDDTMQNSPLELDDTELRQFSLSRTSVG